MRLRSLIPMLALAASPLAAAAQQEELLYDPRENTEGFLFGVAGHFVPAITVTGKDAFAGTELKTTWASGGGVTFGYGYKHRWLFFGTVDVAKPESDNATVDGQITFWHFDFGARMHFHLEDHRVVPYASLAIGAKQLHTRSFIDSTGVQRSATLNARMLAPGVGVQFFPYEDFAIDAAVVLGLGSFNRLDVSGVGKAKLKSDGGTTTRLRVGVNWYPSR